MTHDRPFAHSANVKEYLPWLAKDYVPVIKRLPPQPKEQADG